MGAGRGRDLGNHPSLRLKGVGWCFPKEYNKCHLDFFYMFLDISTIPTVVVVSKLKKVGYSPQT